MTASADPDGSVRLMGCGSIVWLPCIPAGVTCKDHASDDADSGRYQAAQRHSSVATVDRRQLTRSPRPASRTTRRGRRVCRPRRSPTPSGHSRPLQPFDVHHSTVRLRAAPPARVPPLTGIRARPRFVNCRSPTAGALSAEGRSSLEARSSLSQRRRLGWDQPGRVADAVKPSSRGVLTPRCFCEEVAGSVHNGRRADRTVRRSWPGGRCISRGERITLCSVSTTTLSGLDREIDAISPPAMLRYASSNQPSAVSTDPLSAHDPVGTDAALSPRALGSSAGMPST